MTPLQGLEQKESGVEKILLYQKKSQYIKKIVIGFIFGHLELRVE